MSFSKRDFNCTCFSGDKPEWSGAQEWKISRGSTQKPAGTRESPAPWLDSSAPPHPAVCLPSSCCQESSGLRSQGHCCERLRALVCGSISIRHSLSYRRQWGQEWGRRRGGPVGRLWCGWDRWSGLELLGKQAAHQYMSQFFLPAIPSSVPGTQDVPNKCLLKEHV